MSVRIELIVGRDSKPQSSSGEAPERAERSTVDAHSARPAQPDPRMQARVGLTLNSGGEPEEDRCVDDEGNMCTCQEPCAA